MIPGIIWPNFKNLIIDGIIYVGTGLNTSSRAIDTRVQLTNGMAKYPGSAARHLRSGMLGLL